MQEVGQASLRQEAFTRSMEQKVVNKQMVTAIEKAETTTVRVVEKADTESRGRQEGLLANSKDQHKELMDSNKVMTTCTPSDHYYYTDCPTPIFLSHQ
jgi:predicted oxidoreductase